MQVIYIDRPTAKTLKDIKATFAPYTYTLERIEFGWVKITTESPKTWQPK